jgi:uncharacterized LabA/DUF88 family protein
LCFYPLERLALFIDAENLQATARTLGFNVDFRRLREFFSARGKLICTYYFTPAPHDEKSHIFLNWMSCNGYSVVIKRERRREDRPGRGSSINVDLAVHSFMMADNVDHIFIFSGDGNLRRLVEAIKRRRRARVSVISTFKTSPPMIADQLRRQADQFIELAELVPVIGLSVTETKAIVTS